jgi:D-aspartate ligase
MDERAASSVRLGSRAVTAVGALVIIGDRYIAAGIIRSLGRQGIPVWVLKSDPGVMAFSRYYRNNLPWPVGDEERQVGYLLDLGATYHLDGWTLLVTDDQGVRLVAHHHNRLGERFRLTTPSWSEVAWAYDKRSTYQLAATLNLDYPWTVYPCDRHEVEALDCTYPVILKPAVKEKRNSFTSARAWRVENRKELLARYDKACGMVDPADIMVQELIPGGGETQFSFAALCHDGDPLASIIVQRTRQYPVDFGHFSTYVESLDKPEVEAAGRRLLAATRYNGLVEVEFKLDPRTDQYKLLDVNARLWGWHAIGSAAGVDFPYLQWKLLHGEPVAEVRGYAGIRWMRMTGDVRAAIEQIRRGVISPADYLRSLRLPLVSAMFALDDPLPGLLEIPLMLYRRWNRRES